MRSATLRRLAAAPDNSEADPLADELHKSYLDAITSVTMRFAHKVDPTDTENQRSILRAAGGTMAILALAARLAGLIADEAASIVQSGFDSKFQADLPFTKDAPS